MNEVIKFKGTQMKNLAGVNGADESIQEELYLAGIEIVNGEQVRGEVPYSINGKLKDWKFEREGYYQMASAPNGKGLELKIVTKLYEKGYPIIGKNQPKNQGSAIRVAGNCVGIHSRKWAFPNDSILQTELKKLGKEFGTYSKISKLCNQGVIQSPRFVDYYHIDNQIGLNEFARALKEL